MALVWWIPKPPWYSPAGEHVKVMRHNEEVNQAPDPKVRATGLGWPTDVSRETLVDAVAAASGLGWPQ